MVAQIYEHTHALRALLAERYQAATANKVLAALRGVLNEAWKLGFLDSDAYHRAVAITSVRAVTLPAGRFVARSERVALLAVCADDAKLLARRDAAMLAVLLGTGVHRSELVAFDLADYSPIAQSLQVRQGKGNKIGWCISVGARCQHSTTGWPFVAAGRVRCSAGYGRATR